MTEETTISDSALKAGEKVLREMEPDWFLGWPEGSHYQLVSNIVSAVCRVSDTGDRARSDNV